MRGPDVGDPHEPLRRPTPPPLFVFVCVEMTVAMLSPFLHERGDISEPVFYFMLPLEILVLALAGVWVADFVSGMVHLCLDYEVGTNDELRRHVETDIADVKKFEAESDLFKNAKPRDRYLWNFHVHHDAPYPASDGNLELLRQILKPLAIPYAIVVVLSACGILPVWLVIILMTGLTLGTITQFTHFLAHARHRGLVKSRVIMFMQDWHIIIHPDTHRNHHIHFDRDFCILNGWANPAVNRIRRFGSYVGIFPEVAPTTTTRLERAMKQGTADAASSREDGEPQLCVV